MIRIAVVLTLVSCFVINWISCTKAADDKDFWAAIIRGDANAVELMIKSNPEYLRLQTRVGFTPLHYAAMEKESPVLGLLLHHTKDVNVCDNDGLTPLHYASKFNRIKYIRMLLQSGAEVDFSGFEGKGTLKVRAPTPLCKAASLGAVEAAEILIQAGAAVQRCLGSNDCRRMGPVHFACITVLSERDLEKANNNGNGRMLGLLKQSGADLNERSSYGFAPLHYSVDLLRPDIVRQLVRLGADVDCKTTEGSTALHLIASMDFDRWNNNEKEAKARAMTVVRILKEAGANLEAVDAVGRSVHAVAVMHGNDSLFDGDASKLKD